MRLVTLATYSLAGISASRRLLRSCPSAGGRWHLPPPARSAHWPVSSGRNHEEPGRRAPRGVPRGDRYGPRTGPARAVRAARPPPDPVQRVRAARAAAAVVVAVGVGLVVPKLLSAPGRPAAPAAIPAAPGTTPPFMTGQHAYRMDAGMVAAMTPAERFAERRKRRQKPWLAKLEPVRPGPVARHSSLTRYPGPKPPPFARRGADGHGRRGVRGIPQPERLSTRHLRGAAPTADARPHATVRQAPIPPPAITSRAGPGPAQGII